MLRKIHFFHKIERIIKNPELIFTRKITHKTNKVRTHKTNKLEHERKTGTETEE